MLLKSQEHLSVLKVIIITALLIIFTSSLSVSTDVDDSLAYIWPLPAQFSSGNDTLSVDPALCLSVSGKGSGLKIVEEAFERYKAIIFEHEVEGVNSHSVFNNFRKRRSRGFDIGTLKIVVHSDNEELQLGVDESYTLLVAKNEGLSIIGEATIEANTVYGALRGLETFSQLCSFDYDTKSVLVYKAPWYIQDKPRFAFRGLLIDTSRHYLPVDVIEQIIESMSYAKLNVLHWHIIDEQSFPLEVPTYPNLWKGAYSKWERYTVEDAHEIVSPKGINVMAEVDVPGHAESWEETFNSFASNLNPRTVVHNWLGGGVCPKAVAKGFRCIYSNQGFWYLDHLDVPWDEVYTAEPLEGISDPSNQELVLGGEVCMWGETADTSDIQQTIWPRAAAAAERLWSRREAISTGNITLTALPRLHYFRCLLNRRGVQAAPVLNKMHVNLATGFGYDCRFNKLLHQLFQSHLPFPLSTVSMLPFSITSQQRLKSEKLKSVDDPVLIVSKQSSS
ncbi:Beta-hexosaminidase 1 [Citrus sinensis]|uniref:Beta-hexosaminidase 1 n=1 Tax=Citrus sinensis TaxID=2711 RepID=A0ACB8L3K5_CITSI|nr:Beta-hexosaminidase 1 [Citrus sinensis]